MAENNKQNQDESTERFFNTKSMVIAVSTAGISGYLIGSKRGVSKGYLQGLKDGMVQGIAEGNLEGYVKALSDVATVIRNTQN